MDTVQIAAVVGVGVQTITTIFQMYSTFRKSNVERFFEYLLDTKKDLSSIGKRTDLQRIFFSIVDRVAREETLEKIQRWKNALVHLATDFAGVDFKDSYTRILDNLSVLDLTVLSAIYSSESEKPFVEEEIVHRFKNKALSLSMTETSIKRLASHGLLKEMQDSRGVFAGSGEPILGNLYYSKNEFGQEFIRFISEEFKD